MKLSGPIMNPSRGATNISSSACWLSGMNFIGLLALADSIVRTPPRVKFFTSARALSIIIVSSVAIRTHRPSMCIS